MHEFSFESIQIGDSKRFDLNEKSPAYLFETGQSYFKAFTLPQNYPYHISISSYMIGNTLDSAYIFAPQIITLNDDHEVVRSVDPQIFEFKKAGFIETAKQTWGPMYKIEGQIAFTKENMGEKHLVILTTDKLLRAKDTTFTWRVWPIMLPCGIWTAIPVGKDEILVPHSPVGRMVISVFGPKSNN